MNSIAHGVAIETPIPLEPKDINGHVINRAEQRVLDREEWNRHNSVDFRVSLTGMATQFNKSWTTNNQNSVSSELSAYYYHIYSRDKYSSTFKFDGIYGMNFIDDVWFKNQDKLELYHLSSWKMRGQGVLRFWAYGVSAKFASQFAEGFESRDKREQVWSNFMAPGTLNVGVGFTYTSPSKRLPFVVTVNPLSGDGLFVLDDRITDARRQKLGIATPRAADGSLIRYKIEGGSSLTVDFNRTFALGDKGRTLQYITTLNSFYGWMTQVARHAPAEGVAAPADILPTMGWTNRLIFNPLKFMTVEFRTTTVYDRSQVDRMQMQYYLRVGLTYGFKNR
ncbi:MAG: DUF3078 domain-containing protein [Alistipes sp.]|nr:DUF3078 domain-containing protein [Alistipes sp.]